MSTGLKRLVLLGLVLIAGLALAACGGGSGSATLSPADSEAEISETAEQMMAAIFEDNRPGDTCDHMTQKAQLEARSELDGATCEMAMVAGVAIAKGFGITEAPAVSKVNVLAGGERALVIMTDEKT
jgi:hypothetical protein